MFSLSYFDGCGLFGNANAYFFHSYLFVYLKYVSKTEKNQKIIFPMRPLLFLNTALKFIISIIIIII